MYARLLGGFVYLAAVTDARDTRSVGGLNDDGERVPIERVMPIAVIGEAGDLQHGSGFAIHGQCVHWNSQRARDRHQQGRTRPGL